MKSSKILICAWLFILIGCGESEMSTKGSFFKLINDSHIEQLSEKKIYFGHQSVGFNIIDGIQDLLQTHTKTNLRIVETTTASDFDEPILGHSTIGQNTNPGSKIDAFSKYIGSGIGANADICLFKFCYIDMTANTDVQALFKNYKNTMNRLKSAYPQTQFVHVTMPLTAPRPGIMSAVKGSIRKVLGKPVSGYDDNINRIIFNEFLRKEYQNNEPLFELAMLESTYPDGSITTFKKNGSVYRHLAPDYTKDGGHLNALGRKLIAEQFLIFLAELP